MSSGGTEGNKQMSPPPPPSSSPRYLLTVPESITDISKLGIQFMPFHESKSNSSRSIGAKVSHLIDDRLRGGNASASANNETYQLWIKQYKMKVGDVLIKIGNDVVKTRSFTSIMSRLDLLLREKGTVSLTIERNDSCDVKSELDVVKSSFTPHVIDTKEYPSLSIDLSHEHNVLHSIFSKRKTLQPIMKDNCPPKATETGSHFSSCSSSNSSNSTGNSALPPPSRDALEQNERLKESEACLHDDSTCCDLSAIPEESDVSRETNFGGQKVRILSNSQPPQSYEYLSPSQEQQQHYQKYQKDVLFNEPERFRRFDHQKSPPFKTVYRSSNSTISNDFSSTHLGSPSFSYSDSECLISPLGTRISIDAGGTKSIKSETSSSQPIRRKLISSKEGNRNVNKSEKTEKMSRHFRSAYFSPESEHTGNAGNISESPSRNDKSVQFSSHLLKSANDRTKQYNEFHTPNNQHKMKTTHFQSPLSEIHPTSSVESCSVSTVYLSPLSNLGLGAGALLPNQETMSVSQQDSPGTYASCNSFNNIPIHMLDYKYVRECKSYEELEKIVKVLNISKKGGKQQFPSLLRLAKNKLKDLTAHLGNDNHRTDLKDEKEPNDDIDLMREEGKQSDIPSHIHFEIRKEGEGHCSHSSNVGGNSSKTSAIYSFNDNDDQNDGELVENMNSIVIAHAELKNKMDSVLDERDIIKERLSNEVHGLQNSLNELAKYADFQAVKYNEKINSLLDSKRCAEEEIIKLKEAAVSSSKEARLVMTQLNACEHEVRKLRSELELRSESNRAEVEKAHVIQSQLEAKVANLTRQVELYEEDNKASRELIELELRSEYQATSQIERARINELEKCLSHTREELRRVYRENEAISEEFAKAGKTASNPTQLRKILTEYAAAESCANALAKALTESEAELCALAGENRMLKKKYQKLSVKNNILRSENEELLIAIEAMDGKLKISHEVIDNLNRDLKTFQTKENDYELLRSKWVEARRSYQRKIDELKSQLTRAGSMVSVGKYNNALESAEVLKKSLLEKEREIETLLARIRQLETLIDKTSTENRKDEENHVPFPPPSKHSPSNHLSSSKLKKSVKKSSRSGKKRSALTSLQVNNVGMIH